jgi:plastocyanin
MSSHHPHHRSRRAAAIVLLVLGLAVILVVAVVATACGGGTSSSSTTAAGGGPQVVMKGFAFSPASITVKVGESVTWTNQDSATHTVTADNGEFKSADIAAGATYTFKFDKAGTYPYHCSIHSSMKGTVVVQ